MPAFSEPENSVSANRFSNSIGVIDGDWITAIGGERGHLVWGAHEPHGPGRFIVHFDVALTDVPFDPGDPICLEIDVTALFGQRSLAYRAITLSELSLKPRTFALEFSLQGTRELEFRILTTGRAGVSVSRLTPLSRLSIELDHGAPLSRDDPRRHWQNEAEFLDGFLRNVTGLIHIGGNIAQERQFYRLLGLDVIWVEAFPNFFDRLVTNISGFDRQHAIRALLSDKDGVEIEFNESNNSGSSSMFEMAAHSEIFPGIEYVKKHRMVSTTLATVMRDNSISTTDYQALTLDVEGAELLVLQGAGSLLSEFRYVKAEVADFTPRHGSPTTKELDEFMIAAGFQQLIKRPFTTGPNGVGTFWDVVWKRRVEGQPLHDPDVKLPIIAQALDVAALAQVHD